MRKFRSTVVVGLLLALTSFAQAETSDVKASQKLPSGPSMMDANSQRTAQAIGYYERSRSLLLSAVREFDKGYAKANPNVVLNGTAWREDVINRITELDKVLSPQARITEGGVKFEGEQALLASEAGKKR